MMRIRRASVILLMALIPFSTIFAEEEHSNAREARTRAAYIYNLPNFIQWPTGTFSSTMKVVNICSLSSSAVDRQLQTITAQFIGKPIQLHHIEQPDQLNNSCRMLFIDNSHNTSPGYLQKAHQQAILTIGLDSLFLDKGGIIALVSYNNGVQLEINLTAAKLNGFEISSNLLEIARQIK